MSKKTPITLRDLFQMWAFFGATSVLGLADILLVQHGIDAFRSTVTVRATVVAVGVETVEIQRGKTRRDSAPTIEYRTRPEVSYRYELEGQPHFSSRYFLHESSVLADLPGDAQKPDSVTARMTSAALVGKELQVHVTTNDPYIAYVEVGWKGLAHNVLYWLRTWMFFAVFALFGWLLLMGLQKLNTKYSRENV